MDALIIAISGEPADVRNIVNDTVNGGGGPQPGESIASFLDRKLGGLPAGMKKETVERLKAIQPRPWPQTNDGQL